MTNLPLKNNRIDHYTIIVPNGKEVSEFHEQVLGYPFLELKNINTGTAPQGTYDMANYIMEWPDHSGRLLVITEGLTEASIFHRFMLKYGQGIHHIALEIDDVDAAFATLQENNIRLTSPKVVTDMLSGLKQCFIDNTDTGVFIELIERKRDVSAVPDTSQKGFFTENNMSELAGTMQSYLEEGGGSRAVRHSDIDTYSYEKQLTDLRLSTFTIEVPDVQRALRFYADVLGFTRAISARGEPELYLAQEPNIRFHIRPLGREGFNCRLRCTTNSLESAPGTMDGNPFRTQVIDDVSYLDKQKSGYDLEIAGAGVFQRAGTSAATAA